MSIWMSVAEPVEALDGGRDDANYRAEGEAAIGIDVAVTSYHDHIRVAVWDMPDRKPDPVHLDAVLSPAAARALYQSLGLALGLDERPR
jgi:hypothetical protein